MISHSVKIFVNVLWNGDNLSWQLRLNLEKILLIIVGDEVDGQTEVTESSWSADSMQVGLSVVREVEVYHNVNGNDIDTSREDVGAYETTCLSILEVMVDPIIKGVR